MELRIWRLLWKLDKWNYGIDAYYSKLDKWNYGFGDYYGNSINGITDLAIIMETR
jgi:hypothetical protein